MKFSELNNGESCVTAAQCAVSDSICDTVCKCDLRQYEADGACLDRKFYYFHCSLCYALQQSENFIIIYLYTLIK